ncbi:Rossmann-like and DUF2520 domain-containing protein [Aneurinibacillus terranovensis]|uniref:Rossmann-like and DUF2520 domain-containing protein n=1 Tax=Aneurinibacillus terranovensis TaxID=278991 RepID=UPI00042A9099|nr:Rossmann-like and DUF2520 domain-containing protein [Aneurinibacillus terranovensis]
MTTVGFIGAGRLGTSFGIYLARNGYRIQFYNRTYQKSCHAARLAGGKQVQTIKELVAASDWIGITTGDDQIDNVVQTCIVEDLSVEEKVIFHMSGAATSDKLRPLAKRGAHIASLHPLQSFSDPVAGADALTMTSFSMEGTEKALETLTNLLTSLHNPYFIITSDQKPIYHAAATMASNALVAVIDYSLVLMKEAGIEETMVLPALLPLIEGSIKNTRTMGPARALTGPIVRGDTGTVAAHLRALAVQAPEWLPIYRDLARLILMTSMREQLKEPDKINALLRLLAEKED